MGRPSSLTVYAKSAKLKENYIEKISWGLAVVFASSQPPMPYYEFSAISCRDNVGKMLDIARFNGSYWS